MLRALLILLLVWPVASATAAMAQEDPWADNAVLDHPDEVGAGTCSPDVLGALELTTCAFPLTNPGDRLPEWPVLAVIGDRPDFDDLSRRAECMVDDGFLVCPDLMGGWSKGEQPVWVSLDFESPRATVEVDRVNDGVLGFSGVFSRLPVAFAGAPRTFGVFRSFMLDPDDEATLLVRRAGSDEVVAEVPALGPGADEGEAEVVFPSVGRWTVTGCLVDPAGGCAREGFRNEVQVVAPVVAPLFDGHNLPGADRIDLLFVGSGWLGDLEGFVDVARTLLSFDGEPIRLGEEGIAADDEVPFGLAWGPFSIDPLRGATDRFNVWYLPEEVSATAFQRSPTIDLGIDVAPLGLGPHVAVVILARDLGYSSRRASAEWPTFWSQSPGPAPDPGEVEFGSTVMPFRFDSLSAANTLSHEFGHLLFALADEYPREGGSGAAIGYPNCAPSSAVADEWWGDLVGEVDPMFDRWVATESAAGTWYDAWQRVDFGVGFVEGGCSGAGGGVFRPTAWGLMNEESPVFGAVNRRRVAEVLGWWSGRAAWDPELHAGLVVGVCDSDPVADGVRVVCTGVADDRLDPPAGTLGVDIGGATASCAWIPRGGADEIVCEAVVLGPGETVGASFVVSGTEVPLGTVGIPTTTTAPPPSTVAATPVPQGPEDEGGPTSPPQVVLVVALSLMGLAAAIFGLQWVSGRLRGGSGTDPVG